MLTINCACGQSFGIQKDNLINKKTLFCPNCETKVPDEILQGLIALAKFKSEGVYSGANFIGKRCILEFKLTYEIPK